ncbi:ATP-binding protein [Thiohalomonas denitrificans]|uniref:histidine kinase n=1 Tax=Thiohalomonas denitrificans TaxID=415747 RepID=A0A1G5QZJ1_9GAMM|nr:ATP-binding protein [Thiohalomonas denitrificans]SCZ67018.1 Signal transduction histidine kinase [Thiohalomonas denitrificans]
MKLRLWPRALFARLVLVLIGTLLGTILFSLYLLSHERFELMKQVNGFTFMREIADSVQLLDQLSPNQRQHLLLVLERPYRSIALRTGSYIPTSSHTEATGMHPSTLNATLANQLDAGRRFWIHTESDLYEVLLDVTVALNDGGYVSFSHRIPLELVGWPRRVLSMLGILVLSVVVFSLLAVHSLTRPLTTLSRAATRLGRDLNQPPLPERGALEVVHATHAFNRMQHELQKSIRERTRILAAISHDLKTPITRLRLRSESIADPELRQRTQHDLEEIESMILATIDFMHSAQDNETPRLIHLPALLDTLCAEAEELGHSVSLEQCEVAQILARPLAIKRCLGNLIDNAARYGGQARLFATHNAEEIHITVSDDGPGLPESELQNVFEPFYRLEPSRNRRTGGSGLGLGIARNIACDHGGEVRLHNRPGGGLDACLCLPAVAALLQ